MQTSQTHHLIYIKTVNAGYRLASLNDSAKSGNIKEPKH
jgi:hypothetical protein